MMSKNIWRLNTIDEMIEVLQAIKDGKTIEWYCQGDGTWVRCVALDGALPDFREVMYRVKKEPAKVYAMRNKETGHIAEVYRCFRAVVDGGWLEAGYASDYEVVEFTERGVL